MYNCDGLHYNDIFTSSALSFATYPLLCFITSSFGIFISSSVSCRIAYSSSCFKYHLAGHLSTLYRFFYEPKTWIWENLLQLSSNTLRGGSCRYPCFEDWLAYLSLVGSQLWHLVLFAFALGGLAGTCKDDADGLYVS